MKTKVLFVLAFAALVLGCIGGQSQESSTVRGSTVTTVDSAPETPLADSEWPFIEEGDTVEIGQMI